MKRIVAVLVPALLIFSLVGTTYADEKGKGIKVVAGVVKTIDTKAKTITLANGNKIVFKCFFDNRTLARSNMGLIPVTDIKAGSIIAIAYEEINGKKIARTITVATQPRVQPAEKKG